jgi:hypothetical protein
VFLLGAVWAGTSVVFHSWLVAAYPDHPEPNRTLAYVYLAVTPLLLVAAIVACIRALRAQPVTRGDDE